MIAAREGKFSIIQLYFDEKIHFDVDNYSKDGWTAIHYASMNGFITCVDILHRNGATLNT